jgi:cation diffusion facilitator family transporter
MHLQSKNISKKLIRIQTGVLITGILLMAIKAIAYNITSSNLILTDAIESIINTLAGAFALYSLILASKPRDVDHPYGHGKIEFISASIEAAMIIAAGLIMIMKSSYNLLYPQEVHDIDIGIYLTGGAGLLNFALGGILVFHGKKHNSITMEADGKHLLSDGYSTIGMIIGLTIIYFTNLVWIDNAVAILFGLVIAFTGIKILKKSVPGIMDEADMKLLERIVSVLQENRRANWVDLHNLRVIKYGSVYHLDCHITFPWYFNVKEAHFEMTQIEKLIQEHFGSQAEMFIHNDPCKDISCRLCQIADCEVRQHKFEQSLEWNMTNVLSNKQHDIIDDEE